MTKTLEQHKTTTTLTPRVDIAFKKLFGVNENKDLLISLINSIVSQEDQVVDIQIINPYNLQNFKKDKLSILDVKAQDQRGQRYNIEIQVSDEGDYDKRALFCWAKMYAEQLGSGIQYEALKKAIGIHILNFLSIPGTDKYHNTFRLTEKETGIHFFKDMELHTIELRKFEENKILTNELKSYLTKVKTSLDRWVLFLTKHSLLDPNNLPKEVSDPAIKKALGTLNVMNLTKEEREEYEAHLKWLRAEASGIKKAEEKSFVMGRAEGIAEGEQSKAEIIAKNMLSEGLDVKMIARITGLSEEVVKKLSYCVTPKSAALV